MQIKKRKRGRSFFIPRQIGGARAVRPLPLHAMSRGDDVNDRILIYVLEPWHLAIHNYHLHPSPHSAVVRNRRDVATGLRHRVKGNRHELRHFPPPRPRRA